MNILRQMKKSRRELIDWLLCNTIYQSVWYQTTNKRCNSKFVFFFFFKSLFLLEKIVFGLLSSCSLISYSDEILLVKLLLKQLQFVQRFEKRLMVLQYFIIDNIIRMSIFWWKMFFSSSINITFTWCINQFLFLNTFSFLFFLKDFFAYQLNFFLFWQFENWDFWQFTSCFRVSNYLLSILWILLMVELSLHYEKYW